MNRCSTPWLRLYSKIKEYILQWKGPWWNHLTKPFHFTEDESETRKYKTFSRPHSSNIQIYMAQESLFLSQCFCHHISFATLSETLHIDYMDMLVHTDLPVLRSTCKASFLTSRMLGKILKHLLSHHCT